MKRAEYNKSLKHRWDAYKLPKSMKNKSFLDVGCWAGGFVRHAAELGSVQSVGVDSVSDSDWNKHERNHKRVVFRQMNVFSASFLTTLFSFDVVLCSGVLYHVDNPVGLLRRLRNVTNKLCVVETAISMRGEEVPILQYCPGDSFDNNPSNWFLPNVAFLREITAEVGFQIVDSFPSGGGRLCLHLKPVKAQNQKILPRRVEYMRS